ncbi:hypothetical protein OAO87_02500 [bacterium]|nr:hypothetical protein [bacterium]
MRRAADTRDLLCARALAQGTIDAKELFSRLRKISDEDAEDGALPVNKPQTEGGWFPRQRVVVEPTAPHLGATWDPGNSRFLLPESAPIITAQPLRPATPNTMALPRQPVFAPRALPLTRPHSRQSLSQSPLGMTKGLTASSSVAQISQSSPKTMLRSESLPAIPAPVHSRPTSPAAAPAPDALAPVKPVQESRRPPLPPWDQQTLASAGYIKRSQMLALFRPKAQLVQPGGPPSVLRRPRSLAKLRAAVEADAEWYRSALDARILPRPGSQKTLLPGR